MNKQYWIREAKEWAGSIVLALVLTLLIRTFIVQAYKIPSGSMIPTLKIGDKLFVNKYVYRFEKPKPGDIVVFRYPGNPHNPEEPASAKKRDFIKRFIASGGQTVRISDGKIYVDGVRLEEPAIFKTFYYYNRGPYGSPGEQVKVPENSYFVLGDNSANSEDSRVWGFVPKKNVAGKAVFRWWPLDRFGSVK